MFKPFGSICVFTIGNAVIHLAANHFGYCVIKRVFNPYIFNRLLSQNWQHQANPLFSTASVSWRLIHASILTAVAGFL